MIIPTKFSKLYLQTHAMIDAILAPNKGLSVNRVVFMQPMLLCFVVICKPMFGLTNLFQTGSNQVKIKIFVQIFILREECSSSFVYFET